jgi:hypothetical protein
MVKAMKMFDSVFIGCDQGSFDIALAIRSSLELFRLQVYLHTCIQKRNVLDMLAGKIPASHYIILCCHGFGTTNGYLPGEPPDKMEMGFTVVDEDDDWQGVPVVLTPHNILQLVKLPGRTVIALGCGSGRGPLAEAFLDSGCEAYIGPDGPPDQDATALFAITFFYHLLCTERDSRLHMTDEEAVQHARAVDTASKEGTHLFRYYAR